MNINKALFKFIKVATGILLLLVLIYLAVFVCRFCFNFGYRVFNEPAVAEAPGEDVMISISEGMSGKELGEMLEEKGLVNDGGLFAVQLKLSAYSDKMVPGVYTLNTSMTAKDIMVKIDEINTAKEKAAKEAQEKAKEEEEKKKKQESTQQSTETENK